MKIVNSTGTVITVDRRRNYKLICLKCGLVYVGKYRTSCPDCYQNIGVDIYEADQQHNLLPGAKIH